MSYGWGDYFDDGDPEIDVELEQTEYDIWLERMMEASDAAGYYVRVRDVPKQEVRRSDPVGEVGERR